MGAKLLDEVSFIRIGVIGYSNAAFTIQNMLWMTVANQIYPPVSVMYGSFTRHILLPFVHVSEISHIHIVFSPNV